MLCQSFSVQCSCGGRVREVHEDHPFVLTEDCQFVFTGKCDKCRKDVQIKWHIFKDLWRMCPTSKDKIQ